MLQSRSCWPISELAEMGAVSRSRLQAVRRSERSRGCFWSGLSGLSQAWNSLKQISLFISCCNFEDCAINRSELHLLSEDPYSGFGWQTASGRSAFAPHLAHATVGFADCWSISIIRPFLKSLHMWVGCFSGFQQSLSFLPMSFSPVFMVCCACKFTTVIARCKMRAVYLLKRKRAAQMCNPLNSGRRPESN